MTADALSRSSNKREYLLFLLFFFGMSEITVWGASDFILVFLSLIGGAYILFVMQERIDSILIYVILFWLFINFLSSVFLGGSDFRIITFLGSVLKLIIGYAFMKIAKERFISWFEKTVFVLALISIPFFVIQLLTPEFFSTLPFNFAEAGRKTAGHWNGLIFNFSTYHLPQNSGFAGEPGTFGYFIGLAMIFNLILHDGKFNRRFLIFLLIGLTTFSTTYYLTLILFALFFMNQVSVLIRIACVVVAIPAVYVIYQLPFIGDKISTYLNETSSYAEATFVQSERINRLATFLKDMNDVIRFPLGRGINPTGLETNIYGQAITGTNGISQIAVRFGIFGLIYFCVIYFKLMKMLFSPLKGSYLFTLIVFFYIAANPMERDAFAMGLFWLYFVLRQKDGRPVVEPFGGQVDLLRAK